ncbi:MAG: hypothetical protein HFE57_03500 [Firmicutes bacterium]|nr:hypothetical protein [Bacillota bacterium]
MLIIRRHKIIKNYLSSTDKEIPEGYYPIDEVCISLGIAKEKVQEYRRKSFEAAKSWCIKHGSNDVCTFWNINTADFDTDINYFAKHTDLIDIAPLITMYKCKHRETRKREIEAKGLEDHFWHSFCIRKSYIQNYIMYGKATLKKSTRRNTTTGARIYGQYKIIIDSNDKEIKALQGAKNKIYFDFKDWAKENGLTISEAALLAMDEILKRYPVELPKRTEVKGDLIYLDEIRPRNVKTTLTIPGEVHSKMANIVRRFNSENATKITFKDYIINAIDEKNARVPLKYSDPELEIEQKRLEKMQEYYK